MIMASFGRYVAKTGHNYVSRPQCLNLKFRHNLSYRPSDRGAGESMAGIDARAMFHTANVASIASRRPELAGRLGDLSKMPLPGSLPLSLVGGRPPTAGPRLDAGG